MPTFITRMSPAGGGPRLAVKDLIDVEGVPTTAGSRAVADSAAAAARDAACLAGARAAGAAIVGKTNLSEIAFGSSGINQWFGTPVNPLDPGLVPGGSSSGSAVAVATGEADVAYGTDTGGSIRVPAAYCGIAGLRTTHGRISLDGVRPLAPSMDTVGPMAADIAGLRAGMAFLEPGFSMAPAPALRVGRIRPAGADVDPLIDAAVDAALRASGLAVTELALPGWQNAMRAVTWLIDAEAAQCNAGLAADPASRDKLSPQVREALAEAGQVTTAACRQAREFQRSWQAAAGRLLAEVDLLALPATAAYPAPLAGQARRRHTVLTAPVSLAGLPALALPVPSAGGLPASLQLVGPAGGEELLLATGAVLEAAVRSGG